VKDFNPNFGGLNRDAKLIVAGNIYQTLPLYENLKTRASTSTRRTLM
jgi:beta-galactosidase